VANKIKFISNRPWLNETSVSKPEPIIKSIPSWFREADRFAKDQRSGEYYVGPDNGKIPTWKACPALFDIMSTGYMLKTPCDLEFYINDQGIISVKTNNPFYQDFCSPRMPMPQFEHPKGYYQNHFAWFPDWAIEVPSGYSVLYSQPYNRFDVPFLTTSGIIDNDKVNMPGTMPFFLLEGFTGTISAGTPFAQMIPFKREDWKSETFIEDPQKLAEKNMNNSNKYRVPNGGVYKNSVWSKRVYE
jgi:hypothetical protein